MSSAPEAPPVEDAAAMASQSPEHDRPASRALKRKASADPDSADADSPKQPRHDRSSRSPSLRRRRPSSSHENRRPSYSREEQQPIRRPSATLEDKKRGKRLFGGLLSTLSQSNANSQQKRRQEIEKRQQERLHQQKAEDDQKREEKRARLHRIRMAEQMDFEARVMRSKHSKMMWQARHLRTKVAPPLYYLPWKLSGEQEDIIKDQISAAKDAIKREREAFRVRERIHNEKHGHGRASSPARPDTTVNTSDSKEPAGDSMAKVGDGEKSSGMAERDNDDSNEVVVMEEDTIIY